MSRLDRHVNAVRNKLALGRFLDGLAWSSLGLAVLVWVAVFLDRAFSLRIPNWSIWLEAGVAVALVLAVGYALWRRPTAHAAAVAIDERLGLKEKFSTSLYARQMNDPFARAAVLDAERTAQSVSLHKRFPLRFPRPAWGTLGVALLALMTTWMQPLDLFGHEAKQKQLAVEARKAEDARKMVEKTLAAVEAVPQSMADNEQVKLAKQTLEELLKQPIKDPAQAKRTAASAMDDLDKALREQIKDTKSFVQAQKDAQMLSNLQPAKDEKGPVAEAQRAIAKGDFNNAVKELEKAVQNFDKMSEEEQKKAAEQMQKMQKQLQQMAKSPEAQKQMEEKLKQMGADEQQAKEMAKLMQQVAQGDKQAQQQLQQMAQQLQQQMNNGQGPTQQQQQAMQNMMNQMQASANSQQQAQQMAQAAQQMAQAMQQASQQAQSGQQQGSQASQQMAQGAQSMQQALQQMDAIQKDAQQMAAAQGQMQQAAEQAGQEAGDGSGDGQGQQGGQKPGGFGDQQAQGQGGDGQGQPGQGWAGPNRGGLGEGDRTYKNTAPYVVKQETAPTQDIEGNRVLAKTLVNAGSIKGESKEQMKQITAAAEREMTDEVDQTLIPRQAQNVVKGYFESMQKDAERQ